MGGNTNNRKKKSHSSFSIFNFFKSKRGRKEHYEHGSAWEEVCSAGKVWTSDGDKGRHWVAEPGIDGKARDFIGKIHRNRVLETESQNVTVHPSRSDV